jgi:hypothetical protein
VVLCSNSRLAVFVVHHHHHHHHHVTQSSHSINAIGPAPLWSGRKREHWLCLWCSGTRWRMSIADHQPGQLHSQKELTS